MGFNLLMMDRDDFRCMNKNFLVSLMVLIFILVQPTFAQETVENPIDKKLNECIAKDWTTAGMSNCTYEAQDRWDTEMNKYYKLLLGILGKEERELLRQAQRVWLKFRDAELAVIKTIYPEQGTSFSNMRSADCMSIVKDRALQLKVYYELIKEHSV